MQKRLFLLVVTLLTLSLSAVAQVTTSGIDGKVTANNEEVIGATITAKHVPSGTVYRAVTNVNGRYAITGMRSGGPYEVEVSYIGYQTKKFTDLQLVLGQNAVLDVWLDESSEMLQEVQVFSTGGKNNMRTDRAGAVTSVDAKEMSLIPTVSRSMNDILKMTPQGGNTGNGFAVGGGNFRQSYVTVDGAAFNNAFGIGSNLPGNGSPISLDALDQITVSVTPFDVRQSGFTGGAINATTKSGTNEFKGSAYFYNTNVHLHGNKVAGEELSPRQRSHKTTYGATIGGPIIKDKLFFFVNGEYEANVSAGPTRMARPNASDDWGAKSNYNRPTVAKMDEIANYLRTMYGYDPGAYQSYSLETPAYRILARLDWNITDRHHLALRYNYTKNNVWNAPNATSMDGGTRMSGARTSQYSMSFANSMYSMENIVHSFSIDLNSRFTENLSNQFLATYSKLDDVRGTNSSEFPFVDILDGGDNNYMALGYELFTYNNAVHNTIWNIKDDITYYMGAHKLTAGIMFEHQMADNQYMRNGTGYYRYNSIEDFINGAAPEIFCLTYGYGGESKPAARVQFNRPGIYAQDDWNITDNLKMTLGLRVDGLFFNNKDLMTNKAILDIDYNGRHIDTGKWPGNSITFSPRFGFTYDILGDKSLKLRGGTGLFSGRLPLVFFTNMPTNGGMVQYQAQVNAANAKKMGFTMDEFAGGMMTDIETMKNKLQSLGYPMDITPEKGAAPSSICGVDPDFKMPQVWKTSLAVDYQLPVSFPFTATVEGIFNKTLNGVSISDWSIPNVGGFARFNGADNRPIYPAGFRTGTKAFVLENTSRGYGWSGNVTLTAQPAEYISLMAAYTHTVSKEVTGMPGSAAESAFTYVPTSEGPNNIKLHNSQYVTPDRIVASATVHDKCGNHYSLIYETWRGGYNYSYMMVNDINSDGYNYDAIYVPTDAEVGVGSGNFRFVSENDKQRFMDFVHQDSYLKKHQGEYAEAYSVYSPWVHRFDFSYKHDFKLNICKAKHTLQLSLDVKNLTNLFKSSWGVMKYLNPAIGSEARILKYEGVDADGYPTFSTPAAIHGNTETWVPNHAIGQCWYASIGVKYMFN